MVATKTTCSCSYSSHFCSCCSDLIFLRYEQLANWNWKNLCFFWDPVHRICLSPDKLVWGDIFGKLSLLGLIERGNAGSCC